MRVSITYLAFTQNFIGTLKVQFTYDSLLQPKQRNCLLNSKIATTSVTTLLYLLQAHAAKLCLHVRIVAMYRVRHSADGYRDHSPSHLDDHRQLSIESKTLSKRRWSHLDDHRWESQVHIVPQKNIHVSYKQWRISNPV